MKKRVYRKPELKTRKIEFGVFGNYGDAGNADVQKTMPVTDDLIRKFNLHME